MAQHAIGILGRKVGMTTIFAADGTIVPVSVVSVEPNTVTALRTIERDGYTAVQVGAGTARRLTKPRLGQLKNLPRVHDAREFRLDDVSGYEVGQTLDVTLFAAGEHVDVTGVSKGKGFEGTVKRHHFRRGPETHGSDSHRAPGSIGGGTTPGKVFKGTPMAGHMGNDRITVKKAVVVRADAERNVLLVKGPVPGARNALVLVEEGVTMPTTTLYTKTGERDRHRRAARDPVRRPDQHGGDAPGRRRTARRPAHRHRRYAAPAARSAAAGRSRTARRAPAALARAPARRPTTPAVAWSSGRTRAPTSSACPSA